MNQEKNKKPAASIMNREQYRKTIISQSRESAVDVVVDLIFRKPFLLILVILLAFFVSKDRLKERILEKAYEQYVNETLENINTQKNK